jgi:hypothetical protein
VEGRLHLNPLLDAEALAEHDSELCPGGGPLAWRHLPLATDLALYVTLVMTDECDTMDLNANRKYHA